MDEDMRKAEIINCKSKIKQHNERSREVGQDVCRLFKIALGGQFDKEAKEELTRTFYDKLTEYRNAEQISTHQGAILEFLEGKMDKRFGDKNG